VYKLHRLKDGPSREVELSRTDLLQFYREMTIIREMEERARDLYREKKIRGFLHVYVGQEACAVGMEAAITKEDPVITAYRCHGWTYTRGIPVKNIMAELTGERELKIVMCVQILYFHLIQISTNNKAIDMPIQDDELKTFVLRLFFTSVP